MAVTENIPFFVIDDVVEKLKSGTLADYFYDAESASLQKHHASKRRPPKK